MLQRQDDQDFWQSVTGSLEQQETPFLTALREVREETGWDIEAENFTLMDCHHSVEFEIFPHFRYKYAPNVTHSKEHWFLLGLPNERIPLLTEHLAYQWLEPERAAELTKSPNNAQAIRTYLIEKNA
ncbi:dihydroneopterin triphosphate pyrophosphatase [Pasteurella langaaensis DSM 22999]|uniref:Dihydroneopterin triphosphate pyrophosphatase n=2 Tax=Alitibacter langaaensis TaxID=756 RepID=A0A2U0SLX3_9PAST|nr:dihydroneopterin triphosphate pyrophosphatase [Pasteurella langaaensis DSM 22999]